MHCATKFWHSLGAANLGNLRGAATNIWFCLWSPIICQLGSPILTMTHDFTYKWVQILKVEIRIQNKRFTWIEISYQILFRRWPEASFPGTTDAGHQASLLNSLWERRHIRRLELNWMVDTMDNKYQNLQHPNSYYRKYGCDATLVDHRISHNPIFSADHSH